MRRPLEISDLPQIPRATAALTVAVKPLMMTGPAVHEELFERLQSGGASFWSEVYEPFMARDLTRQQVREIVRLGLEHTRGNYKMLVATFNMPAEDYKKFLNFLRKYQCHVPFQRFRMVTAAMSGRSDIAIA